MSSIGSLNAAAVDPPRKFGTATTRNDMQVELVVGERATPIHFFTLNGAKSAARTLSKDAASGPNKHRPAVVIAASEGTYVLYTAVAQEAPDDEGNSWRTRAYEMKDPTQVSFAAGSYDIWAIVDDSGVKNNRLAQAAAQAVQTYGPEVER